MSLVLCGCFRPSLQRNVLLPSGCCGSVLPIFEKMEIGLHLMDRPIFSNEKIPVPVLFELPASQIFLDSDERETAAILVHRKHISIFLLVNAINGLL